MTFAPSEAEAAPAPVQIQDVIIVGAGISGLSLGRALTAAGRSPVLLERARGVGGRCASRRVDGQPVDHGLAFLHGRSPAFLAAMAGASGATGVVDWPRVREGSGVPCQPHSFDVHDTRIAPSSGVNALARHLAGSLDVRPDTLVEKIALEADPNESTGRLWTLSTAAGDRLWAKTIALTMPAPAARKLLEPTAEQDAALAPVIALLRLIHFVPCLTIIARYPAGTPAPPWEACYPRGSTAVHTVLHDSSKRPGDSRLTLVIQGKPGFSRKNLDVPEEIWSHNLMEEAANELGPWIRTADFVQPHRWRYARVAAGTELASPLVAHCGGGAVLAVAGDGLHPAGGVEGAFLSGVALAARLTSSSALVA